MVFENLDSLLDGLTKNETIPAISVAIGYNQKIVFSKAYGCIKESKTRVDQNTVFDIASLTKILTGICFMKIVESGKVSLSSRISDIFPELKTKRPIEKDGHVIGYVDAEKITWYQALTHTTGMGWARPKTRPSLPNLKNGLGDIFNLPFVSEPGKHIVYSDLPIILMGVAMERLTDSRLDYLVNEVLCKPLSLEKTGYLRVSSGPYDCTNIVPTEYDSAFRNQRVWGIVHDENTFLMDGVAGHAGIFSNAQDMCNLVMAFNACLRSDGLVSRALALDMISQKVEEDGERRGLIWQLSSSRINSYTQYLSSRAYGHTGFTGCFMWTDPEMDLSIVFLSNDIYNGRENRQLYGYREKIMQSITEEFQSP